MTEIDSLQFCNDKRNRNPNWTDEEIIRFLELLQEEDVMRDLLAQRNKQVFCKVAERMNSEGSGKTWDQCRIKLKNLKSQYRYIRDRVPNIDELDLENDSTLKQLTSVCQGRGISPSSIKHLKFLKRFLNRRTSAFIETKRMESSQVPVSLKPSFVSTSNISPSRKVIPRSLRLPVLPHTKDGLGLQDDESGSLPPTSPPISSNSHLRFDNLEEEVPSWRSLVLNPTSSSNTNTQPLGTSLHPQRSESESLSDYGNPDTQTNFYKKAADQIYRFNKEMMDLYLDHQKKSQANLIKLEQERVRREQESHERWRQEVRDHERQIFTMFCSALSECNSVISSLLKNMSPGFSGVKVKNEQASDDNSDENGLDLI